MAMASAFRLCCRGNEGGFSGGGVPVDSWTLGLKALCHRRRTGPHPSGFLWTPVALSPAPAGLLAAAAGAGADAAEDAAVLHLAEVDVGRGRDRLTGQLELVGLQAPDLVADAGGLLELEIGGGVAHALLELG